MSCKDKEARRAYEKQYRALHKEAWDARIRRASDSKRAWLKTLKESLPCTDCGQFYPACVMDFDHRDPKTKSGNVGHMFGGSLKRIEAEIAKCDLVCANCHRIRTYM